MEAHGLLGGSIILLSIILFSSSFSISLFPLGRRLHGCLIGRAVPVFILCFVKFVGPMSYDSENTLQYLTSKFCSSAIWSLFKVPEDPKGREAQCQHQDWYIYHQSGMLLG